MKKIISPNSICFFVVLASAIITHFYMVYTADSVASIVGYFVSLAVLPVVIGGVIGCAGTSVLDKDIFNGIKTFWWIPVVGSIASLLPILNTIWAMAQPNH